MNKQPVVRQTTADDLLRAAAQGHLVLYYQPQVDLHDGRIFGAEALLRWRHPERGLLAPDDFLAPLETSPALLPVGWWILREACRQLACWRADGHPGMRIGVNLFSSQFWCRTLAQEVMAALADNALPAESLELEVTETTALHYDQQSLAALHGLRSAGVRIALDDFGTGHASLKTLKDFPLTTLKVDRGFIKDLLTNRSDAAITRAVISLALELGLEIIAEGVETRDQESALRALGCKVGQGHRYAPACGAEAMSTLLRSAPLPSAVG